MYSPLEHNSRKIHQHLTKKIIEWQRKRTMSIETEWIYFLRDPVSDDVELWPACWA